MSGRTWQRVPGAHGHAPGSLARSRLKRYVWRAPTGLLILLAAVSCGSIDGRESTRELTGDYTRSHRVFVFHGNEPVEVEVADLLQLTAVDGEALYFRLRLFAVSGRECALEGQARRRGQHFVYQEPGGPAVCTLFLDASPAQITVTDVESRCGAAHCGEASAIGRVSFPRPKGPGAG